MVNGFPTQGGPKPAGKPSSEKHSGDVGVGHHLYSLYFKGLVSEDSSAGYGVAIFGQKDFPLFETKGPIHGSNVTVLEAELTALKRGLIEAKDLGINHITIYSDNYPIHELVMGRWLPEENKIALLMNDVQRIRERFSSSFPMFVPGDSIKHAYKLARETIVSDINADQMFTVGKCRHRFCSECVRRHIEVRLLEGSVMTCPQFRCKSRLILKSSDSLLTPKLRASWQQRIREGSNPFAERVYCPNPKCSALMSKTELSKLNKEAELRRCCFKCNEPFCINCKVPWHNNLSCNGYKMLHPSSTENDGKLQVLANRQMWHQCEKCQHMIELSEGCVRVICRCGYKFCYRCGAKAGSCTHGHGAPPRPAQQPSPLPERVPVWCVILVDVLIVAFLIFLWILPSILGKFAR